MIMELYVHYRICLSALDVIHTCVFMRFSNFNRYLQRSLYTEIYHDIMNQLGQI